MKFIISGKNMDLTDALKEYVEEKVGKIEKVLEGDIEATITLSVERNMHKVEIILNASAESYRAELSDPDMYATIDKIVDVLLGQIRKTKAKKGKMFKADTIRGKEYSSPIERESVKGEIVKYIAYSMKPMGTEDAKLVLQQSDDVFFTFINIDTEKVNVIYKTNDGNFGVVEPDM